MLNQLQISETKIRTKFKSSANTIHKFAKKAMTAHHGRRISLLLIDFLTYNSKNLIYRILKKKIIHGKIMLAPSFTKNNKKAQNCRLQCKLYLT